MEAIVPAPVEPNEETEAVHLEEHPLKPELTAPSTLDKQADPTIGLKLPSTLHALAWSTGAAVLLGLATALDRARTAGSTAHLD